MGSGVTAGGTLTFAKSLWRRIPFRDLGIGEDYWFRQDTGNRIVRVQRPELHMFVRHGRNTWVRRRSGEPVVNRVLRAMPEVSKDLAGLFSPEEAQFYRSLPAAGDQGPRRPARLCAARRTPSSKRNG